MMSCTSGSWTCHSVPLVRLTPPLTAKLPLDWPSPSLRRPSSRLQRIERVLPAPPLSVSAPLWQQLFVDRQRNVSCETCQLLSGVT
jgi:hypothetical protein